MVERLRQNHEKTTRLAPRERRRRTAVKHVFLAWETPFSSNASNQSAATAAARDERAWIAVAQRER
jgi:hypothetical protein